MIWLRQNAVTLLYLCGSLFFVAGSLLSLVRAQR